MKCQNCGFENSGKFCTMCGAKIDEPLPNTASTEFTDTGLLSQNPYRADSQNSQLGNFTPNPPIKPDNITNNQIPQGDTAYQTPNFSAQPPQFSGSAESSGSPYTSFTPPHKIKNKSKILPVLITILVFAVVFAGIGISIYSSLTSNKSIIDNFASKLISYNDYDSDITTDYNTYDYSMDETAYLGKSDVTFIDCQISKLSDSDKSSLENFERYKKVDLVFEITNTTGYDYIFNIYQLTAYDMNDSSLSEILALNGKSTDEFKLTIKPDATEQFTLSCAVAKDCDLLEVTYEDSGIIAVSSDSKNTINSDKEVFDICSFLAYLADYNDPFLN